MSKRAYCTYFDHRYLARGLALFDSLRAQGCQDEIWILHLSDECRDALVALNLPNVHLISIADLENAFPALGEVKGQRTPIEFYFTCTPLIMEYVFQRQADAEWVTYLDGDLYFFASPEAVYYEIGEAPVAIIPHNFPPKIERMKKFGTYNVGWVTFRRQPEGLNCLHWWAERCLEWCFDEATEDGRFADQGYLDKFPQIAPSLKIIHHPGINLAPWNVGNYQILQRDGQVQVAGYPLVFFHFHGVKQWSRRFYFSSHRVYGAPMNAVLRNSVYRPYVASLLEWEKTAEQLIASNNGKQTLVRGPANAPRGKVTLKAIGLFLVRLADIASGRALMVVKDRVC